MIINRTALPDELIREAIDFAVVLDSGVEFRITETHARKNWSASWRGAYRARTGEHKPPRIIVRLNPNGRYPDRVVPRFTGLPVIWLADQTEALVWLLAHECRHEWQSRRPTRGWYYGAQRKRFSERDADCYALAKLRQWRRR